MGSQLSRLQMSHAINVFNQWNVRFSPRCAISGKRYRFISTRIERRNQSNKILIVLRFFIQSQKPIWCDFNFSAVQVNWVILCLTIDRMCLLLNKFIVLPTVRHDESGTINRRLRIPRWHNQVCKRISVKLSLHFMFASRFTCEYYIYTSQLTKISTKLWNARNS